MVAAVPITSTRLLLFFLFFFQTSAVRRPTWTTFSSDLDYMHEKVVPSGGLLLLKKH